MQSSFWSHYGHAREVLCGYSRWVLGHHGLGTPISLKEAGQVQGMQGRCWAWGKGSISVGQPDPHLMGI